MFFWKAVIAISLSALATTLHAEGDAGAQSGEPAKIEIGNSLDTLNNGYADWHTTYIEGEKKLGDRNTLYGSLLETERFNLNDKQYLAGYYYPLSERWTLLAEGNLSPTHNVLAKSSELGQIQYSLGAGWNANLGLRHSTYNNAIANTVNVTGERYWSNYRLAYTESVSTLAGNGSATNGQLQFAIYYGDKNSFGVGYSQGSEIDYLSPTLGTLISSVHYSGLSGRHWFARDWALSYEADTNKLGSLYTRNTYRLGLRYQF